MYPILDTRVGCKIYGCKTMNLYDEKRCQEIKEINKKENIFIAPTILRSEQIFNTVSGRIKILNKSFISVF